MQLGWNNKYYWEISRVDWSKYQSELTRKFHRSPRPHRSINVSLFLQPLMLPFFYLAVIYHTYAFTSFFVELCNQTKGQLLNLNHRSSQSVIVEEFICIKFLLLEQLLVAETTPHVKTACLCSQACLYRYLCDCQSLACRHCQLNRQLRLTKIRLLLFLIKQVFPFETTLYQ